MALLTQDYPPAPAGMNVSQAPQEIDDSEARYLQDILLEFAGIARRRGPVQPIESVAALPRPASNLVTTIDPAGTTRFAALTGTAANGYLTVWNAALTATSDLTWAFALPTDPVGAAATAYRLSSATPAMHGGTFIGTASDYGTSLAGANQALALWRGGVSPDYATGTISFTRGSTAVVGSGTSWAANVTPGMFLFANTDDASAGTFTATLIGTVYSVNSDTSITLEKASPYSGSAGRTYSLVSLRGTTPKVVKGRITCDSNGTTVSGGNTKFASQGLGTGTWNLYRQRDFAWIGRVSAVPSDISITLAANAAISMADELYIAIRGDWSAADKSTDISGAASKLGWLTAVYAERQWYASNNTSFDKTFRLWFSDTGDVEAVDLSDDGDWIPISSTTEAPEAIRALIPTYNALVVIKDTETFAVYGSSPESFSAKKLEDDGTLSTMSVQPFSAGAIWAGRNGIYFYDGVTVTNMTMGKLGQVYANTMRTFDPTRYRMWSMVARNHYFLHIESLSPTISVTKGNRSTTPNHWVIALNMETRAITLHTNVGLRGSITLPAEGGREVWFVANDESEGVGKVCNAATLFDDEGIDSFATLPGLPGSTPADWTFSGNEITDSLRALGVQGDGLSDDGSTGFWPGTTNLLTNGGLETNLSNWGTSGNVTGSRSNEQAKFGDWSIKLDILDNAGWYAATWGAVLSGATAGRKVTASVWVWAPASHVGKQMSIDARVEGGANPSYEYTQQGFTLVEGWQRLTVTHTVVENDRTSGVLLLGATSNFSGALYADGAQMEEQSMATPYVHTDGATASRSNSSALGPAELLDETQGWVALRWRAGFDSSPGSGYGNPRLFEWGDWPTWIGLYYEQGGGGLTLSRHNGAPGPVVYSIESWSRGDELTVVAAWTATELKVSVNGAAFTTLSHTIIPTLDSWPEFDLAQSGGSEFMSGDFHWFACGTGTLTDADAAALDSLGNTTPSRTDFDVFNELTGIWDGEASTFTLPVAGPDFYYETKKFNAGEDIRLKRIRQVAAHYLAQGGDIKIDTVIGLNDVGSTLTGTLPASVYTWDTLRLAIGDWEALALEFPNWVGLIQGVFRPKKVGFMKKGHHIAFRFYQENADMVRVRLGPQQIGYKPMRPSRV